MSGKKNDYDDTFGDDGDDELEESGETEELSEPLQENEVIDVEQPSRKERRRNRHVDHVANEVEQRLRSALDSRLGSLEQMVRQATQGNQGERQPENGGQPPHLARIQAALDDVYAQTDTLTQAWQAKLKDGYTPEEQKEFTKKARALQEKREELVAVRTAHQMGLMQQRQQDPADVQREVVRQQYVSRHNDVVSHPKASSMVKYADGYFNMRIAEGATDSQELQDEAMDAARSKFGLAPKYGRGAPPPTRESKARMGGTSSSGSGSGSGRKTITVTKAMCDMAETAFPHIKDERKRIEHYINLNKNKGNYK